MKLQLALDDITLDEAAILLEAAAEYVDIIEIGTPFMIEYGMEAVRRIRKQFPQKEILCDTKIMDGGAFEAHTAFRAGSDYVTVMGVTDAATIKEVVRAAKERQKCAVADLLCVENFKEVVPFLEGLGVDMLAVHVGVDQQRSGRSPMQDLIALKSLAPKAKVAVAGGIHADNLDGYLMCEPDVLIVGGAITHAANPAEEAKRIFDQIKAAGRADVKEPQTARTADVKKPQTAGTADIKKEPQTAETTDTKGYLTAALDELSLYAKKIDSCRLQQYAAEIASAKRIFVAGAGRSGLMIRAFAMRLMHLGKQVHVLGDVSTPRAGEGDLLLIGSGSGETKSLVAAGEKAKSSGMRVALNTLDGTSTLAKLADVTLVLPGASPKAANLTGITTSIQPMGSAYEQLSLMVYDALILTLMKQTGQTSDEMFTRHANIE